MTQTFKWIKVSIQVRPHWVDPNLIYKSLQCSPYTKWKFLPRFYKPSWNRTASNDKRCSYTKIHMDTAPWIWNEILVKSAWPNFTIHITLLHRNQDRMAVLHVSKCMYLVLWSWSASCWLRRRPATSHAGSRERGSGKGSTTCETAHLVFVLKYTHTHTHTHIHTHTHTHIHTHTHTHRNTRMHAQAAQEKWNTQEK